MHDFINIDEKILPLNYFISIKILLADQTKSWIESTPQIIKILYKTLKIIKDNKTNFSLSFKL